MNASLTLKPHIALPGGYETLATPRDSQAVVRPVLPLLTGPSQRRGSVPSPVQLVHLNVIDPAPFFIRVPNEFHSFTSLPLVESFLLCPLPEAEMATGLYLSDVGEQLLYQKVR
ncbi:polymerase basic protein 2 [Striga asiatica]|uniref:Polymerase basic protein 2 n=1 Tax=Striga asiatica TaxID=4170 RepID=A0A5A7Q018_STRAF|nr:polymerase basic protein 2 [Striga asiatica]